MYANLNLFCFPLCFEGDVDTDTGAANTNNSADVTQNKKTNAEDQESATVTFTQEDVNRFLADDRRRHQQRYSALETTYQKALQNQQLSQGERAKLEQELADLQASYRTKEQQAEFERKQAQTKWEQELKSTAEQARRWEQMYKTETIERSLLDAAGPDAYNRQQIVDLLRPKAQLKDEVDAEGKQTGRLVVMINFDDVDEKTGQPIKTLRTPTDAVKRMKELQHVHGNLFRSNVVSGIGGAADATPGTAGRIDPSKLTAEQYRKLRKEAPERLGLPPRRI